ncbi:MAG: DUF1684 domain-containing protein [archaeon]|nr:MAG: DUF1684 domain-containing protein [archaeon]
MKPEDVDTWNRALLRFREQKDEFYKTGDDSPLPHGDRATFDGLKYFEPDPGLLFEAKLQRYQSTDSVIMTTSKGTRQLFNKVGYFEFTAGGQPSRVQAYQSAEREDPHLFIPFRDATSGKESYGAARYIDLEVQHDDQYLLDFNYAYNPYCAYSDDFVCPLPPHENWLSVPIRAGEMKFH